MAHDPVRVENAAAWLRKAGQDLRRIERCLTDEPPDVEDALFHCQQAAEKLSDLSQYAWAYRYPTSLVEPPAPEVDEASALAHMILAEVVKRLPSEAREQAET